MPGHFRIVLASAYIYDKLALSLVIIICLDYAQAATARVWQDGSLQ